MKFSITIRDIILLLGIVALSIMYFTKNSNGKITQLNKQIDSINIEIGKKEKVILESEKKVEILEEKIANKDSIINNLEKKEKKIIYYYEKNRSNYFKLNDDDKVKRLSNNLRK